MDLQQQAMADIQNANKSFGDIMDRAFLNMFPARHDPLPKMEDSNYEEDSGQD
jgi:hypothetical protein